MSKPNRNALTTLGGTCGHCALLGQIEERCSRVDKAGFVSCMSCVRISTQIPGRIYADMVHQPESIRRVVVSLISSDNFDQGLFTIAGLTSGTGEGACLADNAEDVGTWITLKSGDKPEVTVTIKHSVAEVRCMESASSKPRSFSTEKQIPAEAEAAGKMLASLGFEYVAGSLDDFKARMVFCKGTKLSNGVIVGVSAEVTWYVYQQ